MSELARDNVSPEEIARFDKLAARWWDPEGESRPLHDLNPVRLGWVAAHAELAGARVADVGCGGGLLSEGLARAGADVVGIDLGQAVIDVARLHLLESQLTVDYRLQSSAELAAAEPEGFDVVCCMELLEHVPDPVALVADLAAMLKPGGQVFVSTVNRTPASFAGGIVAAEYLLRMLPPGTHDYAAFIRPSELARAMRDVGLVLDQVQGVTYNPWTHKATLSGNTRINYMARAYKP